MEKAEQITNTRLTIWKTYHSRLAEIESKGLVSRPVIPPLCQHNAHMYYLLLKDLSHRTKFINYLKQKEINAVFHYAPLHDSLAGKRYGRSHGSLENTKNLSERLVRIGLEDHIEEVLNDITEVFDKLYF